VHLVTDAPANEMGRATTPAADVTRKVRRSNDGRIEDDKPAVKIGSVKTNEKEQIWTCIIMVLLRLENIGASALCDGVWVRQVELPTQ
jgi:hypothetical protein